MVKAEVKNKLQRALASVLVPGGFSGWWCERCEKPAPGIPEEAGSPAKCPHCRKWTAVWIPPADGGMTDGRWQMGEKQWERSRPTTQRARELFGEMRAAAGMNL